jgi:hypothetical protein
LSSKEEENNFLPVSEVKAGDLKKTKQMMLNSLVDIAETNAPVTNEQRALLSSFIDATTRGSVGIMGMVCKGAKCPFISNCPLALIGAKLPIDKKCPVEAGMITNWVNKHLKSLGIENPDDPVHSFDMDMLYEIATQELIKWRCSVHLSDDPRLVSEKQVGATNQGEPIFGDVINPVLDVMERAGRNIAKIREALVATREAQIKAGQVALDPTQKYAEQRAKAAEIVKQRSEKMKDADFKVKE